MTTEFDTFDKYIEKIGQEIGSQANKIAQDILKKREKLIINDISDYLGINNLEQRIHVPIKKGRPPRRHIPLKAKKSLVIKKKKKPLTITKKIT
jgi:hypothetical protein